MGQRPVRGKGGNVASNQVVASDNGVVPVGIDDATRFVHERFGTHSPVIPLEGGAWSQAYAFAHEGHDLVIRFGEHRGDYERDRIAYERLAALLPVPRVVEIGDAFEGAFALTQRAYGDPLELLDAERWQRVLPAVLDVLDTLRRADMSSTTGYGSWDAQANATHPSNREFILSVVDEDDMRGARLEGWRRELERRGSVADLYARAYQRLVELQSAIPEARQAAHCDLINRNVLVDGDSITAVLDWGCAITGDHLYDVAWMGFWQHWHPGLASVDIVAAARDDLRERGVDTDEYHVRIAVAQLHQGLANLAYNVWTGVEAHITATCDVLASILSRPPG